MVRIKVNYTPYRGAGKRKFWRFKKAAVTVAAFCVSLMRYLTSAPRAVLKCSRAQAWPVGLKLATAFS